MLEIPRDFLLILSLNLLRYSATLYRKPRDSSLSRLVTTRLTLSPQHRIIVQSDSRSLTFVAIESQYMTFCQWLVVSSILHRFRDIACIAESNTTHPSLSPSIEGPPSNFVIKLGRQRAKALGYISVKTAWLQPFCHNTMSRQSDRQHNMIIVVHCNNIATFGLKSLHLTPITYTAELYIMGTCCDDCISVVTSYFTSHMWPITQHTCMCMLIARQAGFADELFARATLYM